MTEQFDENACAFPKTIELLHSIPRNYGHSFISALSPHSHITPHRGPTNKKLRCQLPLVVPRAEDGTSGSWLRVGSDRVELMEGKCVIFDDSFEHEAANDSAGPRVVLIFDVWHPDFSNSEVIIFNTHILVLIVCISYTCRFGSWNIL